MTTDMTSANPQDEVASANTPADADVLDPQDAMAYLAQRIAVYETEIATKHGVIIQKNKAIQAREATIAELREQVTVWQEHAASLQIRVSELEALAGAIEPIDPDGDCFLASTGFEKRAEV